MKKVVFRAPVLTQSGYGVHARQVARWLLERKDIDLRFNAVPWGDTPWILDRTAHGGLVGAVMDRTAVPERLGPSDVSLQLLLPNEWDPSLAGTNVGMTAGVETDRCSPEWTAACTKMSRIVVPSRHAQASLGTLPTGLVCVVPESFSDAVGAREPGTATTKVLSDDAPAQNVLVFGQITGSNPHNDRKNTFFAVKWLCELLAGKPVDGPTGKPAEVGIVLKTNAGRSTLIDRDIVVNMLRALLTEVRRGPRPQLTLIHGDMTDSEVADLYLDERITLLAAPTRGEGFGLPILEAAASGLPVVATGWSGHTDFMASKHTKGQLDYRLVDVHPSRVDGKIFVKGARWAEPSEADFKRRVMDVLHDPHAHRARAVSHARELRGTHSFSAIAAAYDAALGDLL